MLDATRSAILATTNVLNATPYDDVSTFDTSKMFDVIILMSSVMYFRCLSRKPKKIKYKRHSILFLGDLINAAQIEKLEFALPLYQAGCTCQESIITCQS